MTSARIVKPAALAALIAIGATGAAAPTPRLHPVKAFTIDYTWRGAISGSETEHSDAHGYRRSTITKTEMRMAGQVIRTNTRAYSIGETIVTIDYARGTASRARNPIYARIVERTRTQRIENLADALIRAMGYQPTGASKTIAGERCAVWKGPTGTTCFTSDALTLETTQMMGPVQATRVATRIRRNDPGPDSAYQADPRYPITEVDIDAILKKSRKR